ncbi:Ivy family c-type lysozyme inhibitor [Acetobacter fallax]|uniref:Inhibitor of vertebrate lysozyme n=1 Tax=Acetobacter fallax TaxID=1737473 RepID=A0ABX0K9I7_9PROT|nr:Ivy family c-type lysozyme inhibitor [Acetobacter fallax]NHO31863.1 hypothetical protein [Acetobacter fallax]NHO35374.1 hypothetical protein [Acetobacter fallax]
MRPVFSALLALCLATPALADGAYTAEIAHQPKFAPAWRSMVTLPAWVTGPAATSVPTTSVTIGGTPYLSGHLCQPHNCADAQMEVIFSADGAKSWGLLSRRRGGRLYQMPLGEPDEAVLGAMEASWQRNNPG